MRVVFTYPVTRTEPTVISGVAGSVADVNTEIKISQSNAPNDDDVGTSGEDNSVAGWRVDQVMGMLKERCTID